MTEHKASRTLVKSPPELWAELSDETSLAGHLAAPFGAIRITRLEPETAIAWEGERASGTVRIEPSGWGTRVTLTARAVPAGPREEEKEPERPAPQPAPLPRPPPAPDPLPPAAEEAQAPAEDEPSPPATAEAPRRGLWARMFGWLARKPADPARGPAAPARPLAGAPPAPAAGGPAPPVDPAPSLAGAPPPPAAPEPAPAPEAAAGPDPAPRPPAGTVAVDPEAVLVGVLDRLGAAHHRPFSRA